MGKTKAKTTGEDAALHTDYQAEIADQLARDWYARQEQVQKQNEAAALKQRQQMTDLTARQGAEAAARTATQKADNLATQKAFGAGASSAGGLAPVTAPLATPMTAPTTSAASLYSTRATPRVKPLRAQLFGAR